MQLQQDPSLSDIRNGSLKIATARAFPSRVFFVKVFNYSMQSEQILQDSTSISEASLYSFTGVVMAGMRSRAQFI